MKGVKSGWVRVGGEEGRGKEGRRGRDDSMEDDVRRRRPSNTSHGLEDQKNPR